MTFGTFDLFHFGHLRLLERARSLGDRLIVGISTDRLNYDKKGRYPVFPQDERSAIVRSLRCVDNVFYEESLEMKRDYLLSWSADVCVMGHDWSGRFDDLADICEVIYLPRTEKVSTTELELFIQERMPTEPKWLRDILEASKNS